MAKAEATVSADMNDGTGSGRQPRGMAAIERGIMISTTGGTAVARLIDAMAFAADKHKNQRRKDAQASPYINHPIALARLLAVEGAVTDVQVLIAAVLHDTVEDTDTTFQELRDRFGDEVADIVAEVTDDKQLPKQLRKDLQIEHAPHVSEDAALVKLADKTCNLRDIITSPPEDWSNERRQMYFDWARDVVHGLPRINEALREQFDQVYALRP